MGNITFTHDNPEEAQETTATCAWMGDPYPKGQWLKDGELLEDSDLPDHIKISPLASRLGSELEFSPVMKDDAGEYTCSVTNPVGSDYQVKTLRVMSKSDKSTSGLMASQKINIVTKALSKFLSYFVVF